MVGIRDKWGRSHHIGMVEGKIVIGIKGSGGTSTGGGKEDYVMGEVDRTAG